MANTRGKKKRKTGTLWFIGLTVVLVVTIVALLVSKKEVLEVEVEKVEKRGGV